MSNDILKPRIHLTQLATAYELTGADIMNVVQHCCLKVLQRGKNFIEINDVQQAIKRELRKVGKMI